MYAINIFGVKNFQVAYILFVYCVYLYNIRCKSNVIARIIHEKNILLYYIILFVILFANIARFLQYFNNVIHRFRNISAISQY